MQRKQLVWAAASLGAVMLVVAGCESESESSTNAISTEVVTSAEKVSSAVATTENSVPIATSITELITPILMI